MSCSLCAGIQVAQHLASAQHKPSAFCGACGRPIPTVVVLVVRQAPSDAQRQRVDRRADARAAHPFPLTEAGR